MEEAGESCKESSPDGISPGHSRVIIVMASQFGHLNLAPVTAEPAKAPRETRVKNAPQLIFTPLMSSKLALAWFKMTFSASVTQIVLPTID